MESLKTRPVQDNKGRLVGAVAIASGAVVASSNALALKAADITAATADSGAESTIDAGYLWVLGIVVALFVGRKIVGMFGK